jgi:hypothetical protein
VGHPHAAVIATTGGEKQMNTTNQISTLKADKPLNINQQGEDFIRGRKK